MTHDHAFLAESIRLLEHDYAPRVHRALDRLPAGDLWWRPNDASNSAGNLLLHMAGNLRQWVVSGVGGEPDRRRRDDEFAADGSVDATSVDDGSPADVDALLATLDGAVADALDVLRSLDPARLDETVTIQGEDVTVLQAVYHAVEHFAMHTGQLLWIAKARSGRDLGLYGQGDDGHPRRLW